MSDDRKAILCRDETAYGEPESVWSPSRQYLLVITKHKTGERTWDYTKGRVYHSDRLINTVCRNYSSFPYAWAGPERDELLICGANYQGQTVIHLPSNTRVDYVPQEAAQGAGFCWVRIHPSPDGKLVAVEGCYWGAPYQTVIYDFAKPLQPPWPELARLNHDSFGGWLDVDVCRVGDRREVVNVPGHRFHGRDWSHLTLDETEELDTYIKEHNITEGTCDHGIDEVFETIEWRRP